MKKTIDEDRLRELAAQFKCPSGEQGSKTGENMYKTNRYITELSVKYIQPKDHDIILEIGMGIARQAPMILQSAKDVKFVGVEMSPLMLECANEINREYIEQGQVVFHLSDGNTIPLPDNSCNKVFTVNTLYFWEQPLAYLNEIYRVLTPGGQFCLTFASPEFMSKLPFKHYGFDLYEPTHVLELFKQTPFKVLETHSVVEPHVFHVDGFADREVFFVVTEK